MNEYLTADEVAELLRMDKSTAYKRVLCKPTFPRPVKPAGRPLWKLVEVMEWTDAQRC